MDDVHAFVAVGSIQLRNNALAALLDMRTSGKTTLKDTASMGGLAQLREAGLVVRNEHEDVLEFALTDYGQQILTEYDNASEK